MAKGAQSNPSKQDSMLEPLGDPSRPIRDARAELIKHYPTLERLFGELDFCACDHCRSVLSPAAYLVDLLKFLDPEQGDWLGYCTEWELEHDAPYPFKNQDSYQHYVDEWKIAHPGEDDIPNPSLTPFERLRERRQDLPHLLLTCENTHTVLPYIDVVNEILEYSVEHNQLDAGAAYDVGDAKTEDLLAEPQNLIPEAYETLRHSNTRYPMTLPFDLWLETVRRFLDALDVPLPRLLEVMCSSDDLAAPQTMPAGRTPYGWREVFTAQLGISRAEYEIFTSPSQHAEWYKLYGYSDDGESGALDALRWAKTLARRLNVSYQDLVDLVRTGFVNPRLDTLRVLRRLGLDVPDVLRYFGAPGVTAFSAQDRAAFDDRLDALTTEYAGQVDIRDWLASAWDRGDFTKVLVLSDSDPGCSFDQTTLRYADGTPADGLIFLQINLLVRLRRRLGWSLAEVDAALGAFVPSASRPLTLDNLGPTLASALLNMAHLNTLAGRTRVGRNARQRLLALWTPLSPALYDELFLTPRVEALDPTFDHPLGQYLGTGPDDLVDHLPGVQAALNLTTDEVKVILADVGRQLDDEPLTMDIVSLLYRYRLLAKGLKLSIQEIIVLKGLSGVDPFAALPADPISTLADDVPFAQTLRFTEIVTQVRDAGINIDELDFLLRHRFDPAGPHQPRPEAMMALVRALVAGIRRIRAEHAVPDNPLDLTDELLAQKVSLVLPPDVAATFVAMWAGTVAFYTQVANIPEANRLNPLHYAKEPAITVSYDPVSQTQHLTHRGVLGDSELDRLRVAYPKPLFIELLKRAAQTSRDFFAAHLLRAADSEPPTGFLTADDFDPMFVAPRPGSSPEDEQKWQEKRRAVLAEAFLPYLQHRLVRGLIVTTLASDLGVDPTLVETLSTETALLSDPSTDMPASLLAALADADEPGLTAEFYATLDASGAPLGKVTVSGVTTVDKPAGTASARIDGYLEVPVSGSYRFYLDRTAPQARAELRFDHLADPLLRFSNSEGDLEVSGHTELRAATPYRVTVEAFGLDSSNVTLEVRAENLPKGPLDRLTCYPASAVERARRAYTLLAKVLRLATALNLDERELRHYLPENADNPRPTLDDLPTGPDEDTTHAATLFARFLRLVGYVRLRRELGLTGSELIDVFRYARRSFPLDTDRASAIEAIRADLAVRFGALIRRKSETVQAAAEQLGYNAQSADGDALNVVATGFTDEVGLYRLWNALSLADTVGVTPQAIGRWAHPAPEAPLAWDLRATLHTRYEPEAWRRVARPVFDALRQARRDALVAYLLHREGYERVEQLYEHFLVDPGTEPAVQTSRLRLAISTVQLFIQRCLLNLELWVDPSAIKSAEWQWMCRYRPWEANRKIWLWPENWLEPEWRDDKTHLYRELESSLLQGDITNDLAEEAFFTYLTKLEELARLEIMSIWLDEQANSDENVLHVVGRTYNTPHQYFYRCYAYQEWTPWEPVTAEVEGDYVVLAVLRDRPHLFWLTFLEQADPSSEPVEIPEKGSLIDFSQPQTLVSAQLNWSEYAQGQWTAANSSGVDIIKDVSTIIADAVKAFVHVTVEPRKGISAEDAAAGLAQTATVSLGDKYGQAFGFAGRNSNMDVGNFEEKSDPIIDLSRYVGGRYTGGGPLRLKSGIELLHHSVGQFSLAITPRPVGSAGSVEIGSVANVVRPFFFQDGRNTFYVEPSATEPLVTETDLPSIPRPSTEAIPERKPITGPGPYVQAVEISPFSIYGIEAVQVGLGRGAEVATTVQFDESAVGPLGADSVGDLSA